MKSLIVLLFLFSVASAEVYFSESFDDNWASRWVVSKHREDGSQGAFEISAGKFFNDAEEDKGLRTTQDAKFYAISAEMTEFSNLDKTLIIQYSVKHEQRIDCGGAYVKVYPAGIDQDALTNDSPYNIMFGPDICGATKRTHVIFNYNGENKLVMREVKAESDETTHLYTLIVRPDQTYEVLIDRKSVQTGNLIDDFDFLPPKQILDPDVSKPEDWVDEKEIDDPEAVKPEGWDDIPAEIPDSDAKRPDDWDEELDGEWEAPTKPNPDFKGEWVAGKIPNPAYKGEWVHPKIPNPDYKEDNLIYAYDSHKYIGIEIWQVKSGTIFDNFLVTDDEAVAEEWAQKTVKTQEGEKAAQAAEEEANRAKAAEQAAEAPEDAEVAEEEEDLDLELLEEESAAGEQTHDEL
jgi:calreticulin